MHNYTLCNFNPMKRTIIATKLFNGRLVERKFNEFSWDLLGENKNGWTAKDELKVTASIPLPPKGETAQVIKPEPKIEAPVVNEVPQEVKNEFMTLSSKIGKGAIKDYFDKVGVTYSNTANIIEIRTQLASVLNYNIEKLSEAFK